MADVQVKLTEFSDLVSRYTADFVGREWLVAQVEALIDDPGCRFVVLTGGPGVGKTAFLAHLASTHPNWPRYFIRRDSRELLHPGDASTFLLTIGGQLATLYPHLFHPENLRLAVSQRFESVGAGGTAVGVRIDELRASPFYRVALEVEQEIQQLAGRATAVEIGRLVSEPRAFSMQDLQYLGLLDPARLLAQTEPDERIVVLVDALDELRFSPAQDEGWDILRVLREMPDIPPNLRFVVTSRPDPFLAQLLARHDACELPLDVTGAENRGDMRAYAGGMLVSGGLVSALAAEELGPVEFIDGLLDRAAGNFLYLRGVLDGIREAAADPARRDRLHRLLRVEELPADLGALYGYFLASVVDWAGRAGFGQAAWRLYLKPLLGALAVAQEPLGEQQLAAFSGLNRSDVRDLLRELRQFVDTVDVKPPVYRIYHASFADYLLDGERNRDYWVDGLEMHNCIADWYLEAWGGMDAGLPGLREEEKRDLHGGYGRRRLADHLAQAGNADDVHRLLRLERVLGERCENVWNAAEEAAGDTAGYLATVSLAWRLAEREFDTRDSASAIGLQCRYALITASLASLAERVPHSLLVALVERGVWTPVQGLAYAGRLPDPGRRAETLAALASFLPGPRREQALCLAVLAAQEILHPRSRSRLLAELAPRLPESALRMALAAVLEMPYDDDRSPGLAGIAPHLAELGFPREALALVREMPAVRWLKEAWTGLACHLPADLLPEALALARGIQDGYYRAEALAGLAPRLSLALLREALSVAQEIEESQAQAQALQALASALALEKIVPHLPQPPLDRALTAVEEIEQTQDRPRVPAELAIELARLGHPQEALEMAREVEDGWRRARLFEELIPDLPEPWRGEAVKQVLAMARDCADLELRVYALVGLSAHLPGAARDRALREALGSALRMGHGSKRKRTFDQLVPCLPEPLLREAQAALLAIGDADDRARTLSRLAAGLPEPVHGEAVAAARAIQGAAWRAEALADLGDPQQAMASAREVDYRPIQHTVLIRLAERFARQGHFPDALVALREAGPSCEQTRALLDLAPQLPQPLLHEALGLALCADDVPEVLAGLAPHLPEPFLCEAFEAVQAIESTGVRAEALACLSPCLPPPLRTQALEAALAALRDVDDGLYQKALLEALAPHLPEGLMAQALDLARDIGHPIYRMQALAALGPYLPEPLLRDALAMAQDEEKGIFRSLALVGLAPRLATLGDLQGALSVAREIESADRRAQALATMVAQLPQPLRADAAQAALEAAEDVWDREDLLKVLTGLIPGLPASRLPEALDPVRDWGEDEDRALGLARLAPYLPGPLREATFREALAAADGSRVPEWRLAGLTGLISLLPSPWQEEAQRKALAAADAVQNPEKRLSGLARLVPLLSLPLRDQVLHRALALAQTIASNLWSPEAEREAYELKEPFGDWMPRLLVDLARRLVESGEPRSALMVASAIQSAGLRAEQFAEFAEPLAEFPRDARHAIWCQALHILAARTRGDLLSDLHALAPVLLSLGGPEAAEVAVRAVQDVGRWWP